LPNRTSAGARKRLTASDRRELIARAATELFGRRGYNGASVEEIARNAGVTPPVVYDHFASKHHLFSELVEHHYAALRAIWSEYMGLDLSLEERISTAIDAWFAYIEEHPFVAGLLFREPPNDPAARTTHRAIRGRSRRKVLPLVGEEAAAHDLPFADLDAELTWETMRAVLQGLALWWNEHLEVPRARIVSAAMDALWLGFERVLNGERWKNPH